MLRYFLFMFMVTLYLPAASWACSCVAPSPDMDQGILSKVDVAGRFVVVDHKIPDWNGKAPYHNEYVLQIEKLYRSSVDALSDVQKITVINDGADGCARYIEVGRSYDLLLTHTDDTYTLMSQCAELSDEMWRTLAQ